VPHRLIDRIREKIRLREYDMTVHAMEEMAEDDLDVLDIEEAVLKGRISRELPVPDYHRISHQQIPLTRRPTAIGASTAREPFDQRRSTERLSNIRRVLVILEGITVGVCDVCGARYYSAEILHAVHDVATGAKPFDRLEEIPVSHLPG
jgi:YgiT-type zinc finger domain-containing protein